MFWRGYITFGTAAATSSWDRRGLLDFSAWWLMWLSYCFLKTLEAHNLLVMIYPPIIKNTSVMAAGVPQPLFAQSFDHTWNRFSRFTWMQDCEPDENLEEEMPFSLDLGWSQPSQDLAIQSQVSVHKADVWENEVRTQVLTPSWIIQWKKMKKVCCA